MFGSWFLYLKFDNIFPIPIPFITHKYIYLLLNIYILYIVLLNRCGYIYYHGLCKTSLYTYIPTQCAYFIHFSPILMYAFIHNRRNKIHIQKGCKRIFYVCEKRMGVVLYIPMTHISVYHSSLFYQSH